MFLTNTSKNIYYKNTSPRLQKEENKFYLVLRGVTINFQSVKTISLNINFFPI